VTPLFVALGAAAGAPLRYWLATRLDREGFPLGIWLVNVAGSTLLGVLVGLGTDGHAFASVGVGFCGALTTFSTFAVQTVGLGTRRGAVYALATVAGSLVGCALGYVVGAHA
jgi:CrcB protein